MLAGGTFIMVAYLASQGGRGIAGGAGLVADD
jgi:hypothetical protein